MLSSGRSTVTAEVPVLCLLPWRQPSVLCSTSAFQSGLGHGPPLPNWATLWMLFQAKPPFPHETGENTAWLVQLCEEWTRLCVLSTPRISWCVKGARSLLLLMQLHGHLRNSVLITEGGELSSALTRGQGRMRKASAHPSPTKCGPLGFSVLH